MLLPASLAPLAEALNAAGRTEDARAAATEATTILAHTKTGNAQTDTIRESIKAVLAEVLVADK